MSVSYRSTDICHYLIVHPTFMTNKANGILQPNLPKLLETVQRIGHLRSGMYNGLIRLPPGNKSEQEYLKFAFAARKDLAKAVLTEDGKLMTLDDVLDRAGKNTNNRTTEVVTAFYQYRGNEKKAIKASETRKIQVSHLPPNPGLNPLKFHDLEPGFARYSNS